MKVKFLAEKWWPHLFGLCCVAAYVGIYRFLFKHPVEAPEKFREVTSVMITIAGVAVAFIAAIQGIFLTVASTDPIVERLKQLGVYNALLSYFSSAIRWCLILIALSFAAFFFELSRTNLKWPELIYFLVWIFSVGTAGGACFRITTLFNRILRS